MITIKHLTEIKKNKQDLFKFTCPYCNEPFLFECKEVTINEKNDIVTIKCPTCGNRINVTSSLAFGEKYNGEEIIIKQ